jgi:hypothetical protein
MTIEDLKEWMDERFQRNDKDHEDIKTYTKHLDERLISHGHWLWLIRGIGIAIVAFLTLLGFKIGV